MVWVKRERNIMKHIVIAATGGTIAGTGNLGKAAVYEAGKISIDEVVESIPMINDIAKLSEVQLFNVDSNEMDEYKWTVLANTLNGILKRKDVDGVVVTHGTDTLDETAYFLNLTLHTDKPVVITGAMRPATATSADGPVNLFQAVSLASCEEARGHGVMAVFSSTIYAAREIQKVHNFKVDAFGQRELGCLGYMRDEVPYMYATSFKKHTKNSVFSNNEITILPKVGIAYYYAGADASILKYMSETHDGIVIAGSGSGNYSQSWKDMINKLYHEKGTLFVRSSRVNQGIVFESSIFDPQAICVPANTLSAQKARVLLMLALTRTRDLKQIKDIFDEY